MRWLAVVLLCSCTHDHSVPVEPDPDPDPVVDPTPFTVTLDGLQPGWRVTTSRQTAHDAPSEHTVISDGAAIDVTGARDDVFVATVTDATGALVAEHSMGAHCNMAASRQIRVPADYASIQVAIDAAHPGDTVKVEAGEYSESVAMRPGVCLLGAGAKHTILDAHGEPRSLIDLSGAPGSVVAGFTLRGTGQDEGCAQPNDPFVCSGNWYHAAIYIGGSSWLDPTHDAPPVIMNNVFEGNDTGVIFGWRSNSTLRNNVFVGNRIGFVANHYQDRATIANNVFVENTELAIGNQAAYLDIVDNIIVGSATGIRFEYVQTGYIRCNVFWNVSAIQSTEYPPDRFAIGQDGNVVADPKLPGNGDWHIPPDSPGHDHGCHGASDLEPDGSLPDIGVYGGPLAAWVDL